MIARICVADDWLQKGVFRALAEQLVEITKARGLRGIVLRCRREPHVRFYDARRPLVQSPRESSCPPIAFAMTRIHTTQKTILTT